MWTETLPTLPPHTLCPSLQDQDCFGGCFSPSDAFFGDLAAVRIWRRVLGRDEVRVHTRGVCMVCAQAGGS